MMSTTEEQIKEVFERFKPNSIERVMKLKDYAFVHFKQRDDALHAMNLMNGRFLCTRFQLGLSVYLRL